MVKIGRNDPCPCGSGLKFKKCCLLNPASNATNPSLSAAQQKISLAQAIDNIRESATDKIEKMNVMGVFVFFSTTGGDAWLLEVTEMDAVQLAENGSKVEIELEESPETIMVNWSHKFTIKKNAFITEDYKDKRTASYPEYPVAKIKKAIKKTQEKISPEILKELHIKEAVE